MISVIIPVYNTVEYLDQCIASVVNQSYRDLEVLLIDDCSSDGSVAKLCAWEQKDPRIRVILKESNSGVSASRNLGLQKAQGEFISFVDSDDWLEPDFYSALFHWISETGADVALGGYNRITGRHVIKRVPDKSTGTVLGIPDALSVCMPRAHDRRADLYIWDKLFRRTAILKNEELILFESYSIGEDVLWLVRVLLNSRSAVCWQGCGYNYRYIRQGNTSLAMSRYCDLKKCRDAVDANRKVLQLLSGTGTRIENYALQRVLFYRRYAFRTAANLGDKTAYREYRDGYCSDLWHCYRQNITQETFRWLLRQLAAELRFRLSWLNAGE